MKVHTQWRPATDVYDVWLMYEVPGGMRVLEHKGGDVWQENEVPIGTTPEPTFSLRSMWLEALARELSKLPAADEATVAALKDAQAVRDRLLSMVEVAFQPVVTRPSA